MPAQALVSVVIPAYNHGRYLGEAIASVLAQTCSPMEIIVVDDGSTDDTAAVARRFEPHIRYVYQQHSGAAAARNHGVELATGEYLSFLDADDLWVADKLARQMAALVRTPGLDMISGHVQHFYSAELDETTRRQLRVAADVMPGPGPSTMLITRRAFDRVGPFATTWQLAETIDWLNRAVEKGLSQGMLSAVVVMRRIHAGHLTAQRRSQVDYARVLKATLDRRRKEQGA